MASSKHYAAKMDREDWVRTFTCSWSTDGRLNIKGFREETPLCLRLYLRSIRPDDWDLALQLIAKKEGHSFADGIGITFPQEYEYSSSEEEDDNPKGPIPDDKVEFFAGRLPKCRLTEADFLDAVSYCLSERRKLPFLNPLNGEGNFMKYISHAEEWGSTGTDFELGPSQLTEAEIRRTISLDSLTALLASPKQSNISPLLTSLDLATNIANEDFGFTDWATDPNTKQLALNMKKMALSLTGLEAKHEIAQRQVQLQEGMVSSLHREITRLTQEQETTQKILLDKGKEIEDLTGANKGMKDTIDELLAEKTKLTNKLVMMEKRPPKRARPGAGEAMSASEPTEPIGSTLKRSSDLEGAAGSSKRMKDSVETIEDLIRNNYTFLRKELQVEKLIPHFIERGLLDVLEDRQVVMSKITSPGKAEALLELLTQKGTCTPEEFVEILKNGDHEYVAVELERMTTRNENAGPQVFICHAGPDKARFVRPLVQQLQEEGLPEDKILDEIRLSPADDFAAEIRATLSSSSSLKLVVFVISHHVLNDRHWPKLELELTLQTNKKIFPIWLDQNDDGFTAFGSKLRKYSPALKGIVGRKVLVHDAKREMASIAEEIVRKLATA
ncbi:uncharacterized protein LOC144887934 [Branchiostoma floridae x Branchiostoma japonicum]